MHFVSRDSKMGWKTSVGFGVNKLNPQRDLGPEMNISKTKSKQIHSQKLFWATIIFFSLESNPAIHLVLLWKCIPKHPPRWFPCESAIVLLTWDNMTKISSLSFGGTWIRSLQRTCETLKAIYRQLRNTTGIPLS